MLKLLISVKQKSPANANDGPNFFAFAFAKLTAYINTRRLRARGRAVIRNTKPMFGGLFCFLIERVHRDHLHLHNVPEHGFVGEAMTAEQPAMFKISIENSTARHACHVYYCRRAGAEGVLFHYGYTLYKFTYYSPRQVIATFLEYP